MTDIQYEQFVETEKRKLEAQNKAYAKLNILFNLIEIKSNKDVAYKNGGLFLDLKELVNYYVGSLDETYADYYSINEESKNKMLKKIAPLKFSEQVAILSYLRRLLLARGYSEEAVYFESAESKARLKVLTNPFKIKNLFSLILEWSTYNLWRLVLVLILIFFIYAIFLYPSNISGWGMFKISYVHYSEYKIPNHLLNCLLSFSEIDSDFKIEAISSFAVILLFTIKLSIFIVLFGYITKEIKRKINL